MRHHVISEEEYKVIQQRVGGGVVGTATRRGKSADGEAAMPVTRSTDSKRREPCIRAPQAGSNPAPSPKKKSKWEVSYGHKLDLDKMAGVIKDYRYEGITLTLSKGQYHRPDFIVWHMDNSVELAQVKGWHRNLRAGIKGLKWAAQLYPMFTWTMKRWTGTGWDSSYVEV